MSKPSVFPTQHILTVLILTTIAYAVIFLFYSSFKKKNALRIPDAKERTSRFLVFWILFAALAVRIMVSCLVVGHKTDITCFAIWGNNLATGGFKNFYNPNSGMPDYPPGYMYILGLMSRISSSLGHGVYDANKNYDLVYVTIIKLPSIIADLAASYIIFRLARKKLAFMPSLLLMSLVAFSPLMIYISSGWGQIDQILAVLILVSILALNSNKPILAGILYGFAILMKPQALMVGPLMALAYVFYVFDPDFFKIHNVECRDKMPVRLLKTIAAVACACLMIILAAIPFSTEAFPWYKLIVQKYLGTATSYKFASVNAYNIYALCGHNWTKISERTFIGLTFGQVGTIGMVISVLAGGALYFFGRKKNSGALYLAVAFTFISLFMLGHYMHERYLFPALLLLLVAYICYGDRRLLYLFFGFSVTTMLNCLAAFYYSKYHEYQLYWDKRIVFGCSLANVIIFILFAYVCFRIMIAGKTASDVFSEGKTLRAGSSGNE